MTSDFLLLVQLASTLPLVGLIWTVQLVVYPQFAAVGSADFERYHERHMKRISLIVGPLIAVEAVTAVLLVTTSPPAASCWLPATGLILVVGNLATTAFVQVPLHRRLAGGRDESAIRRLVTTNWVRTALWTARAAIVLYLVRA